MYIVMWHLAINRRHNQYKMCTRWEHILGTCIGSLELKAVPVNTNIIGI